MTTEITERRKISKHGRIFECLITLEKVNLPRMKKYIEIDLLLLIKHGEYIKDQLQSTARARKGSPLDTQENILSDSASWHDSPI